MLMALAPHRPLAARPGCPFFLGAFMGKGILCSLKPLMAKNKTQPPQEVKRAAKKSPDTIILWKDPRVSCKYRLCFSVSLFLCISQAYDSQTARKLGKCIFFFFSLTQTWVTAFKCMVGKSGLHSRPHSHSPSEIQSPWFISFYLRHHWRKNGFGVDKSLSIHVYSFFNRKSWGWIFIFFLPSAVTQRLFSPRCFPLNTRKNPLVRSRSLGFLWLGLGVSARWVW